MSNTLNFIGISIYFVFLTFLSLIAFLVVYIKRFYIPQKRGEVIPDIKRRLKRTIVYLVLLDISCLLIAIIGQYIFL